jgi:hypothetical protein
MRIAVPLGKLACVPCRVPDVHSQEKKWQIAGNLIKWSKYAQTRARSAHARQMYVEPFNPSLIIGGSDAVTCTRTSRYNKFNY